MTTPASNTQSPFNTPLVRDRSQPRARPWGWLFRRRRGQTMTACQGSAPTVVTPDQQAESVADRQRCVFFRATGANRATALTLRQIPSATSGALERPLVLPNTGRSSSETDEQAHRRIASTTPTPEVVDLDQDRQRHDEAQALAWRRARGLLTLRDLADEHRHQHWCRPGLLAALPTDRLEGQIWASDHFASQHAVKVDDICL